MRELPLYEELPVAAVEAATALSLDSACTRCTLSGLKVVNADGSADFGTVPDAGRPSSVCIPDEGAPGGVLLVGEGPGAEEDRKNRPFVGQSGALLRPLVARWYRGPVVLANATRCRPFVELDEEHVDACRGYLAQTVADARPERIVALGAWAAYALTGRRVAPMHHRRGYAYLVSGRFGRPVPVYFVLHPAAALRNRFVRRWFEEDLEHALTRPRPPLPPIDEVVRVVETAADADRAVADAARSACSSIDVESAGVLFDRSFRLLCLSVSPERADGDETAWVWDEAALADSATRGPLLRYLADASAVKIGANVKFDENALEVSGFSVHGVRGDVRLWRKLVEPEASGALESIMELVGMGGSKDEQARAEASVVEAVKFGVHTERRLAKAAAEGRRTSKLSDKATFGLTALADLDARLPYVAALARDKDVDSEAWAKAVVPEDTLLRYCGRDAVSTKRARVHLAAELRAVPQVDRIRRLVVDRAAHAVRRVEEWGVPVDVDALRALDAHCLLRLGETRGKLDVSVGRNFNPGSPVQLRELLFTKLRLRSGKTTRTGLASTDEEVLESLRGRHPVADLVLEHRKWAKIQGTYAGGMLPWVRPDNRVHCSILLDGARCMPAGELVLTSRGYLPVEEVRVGDFVLTHKGRARPVTATYANPPMRIVRVRLENGLTLRTTEDHEYMTDAGWVPAADLRVGLGVDVHADTERWRANDRQARFGSSSISAIELERAEANYGLAVEEDHSHVTAGIVTHNSGRASIQDPPMQTLPSPKRDPELGRLCRDVFAAPSGKKLLQADYKQVEFRVAAMLSRDPVMIADIVAGFDPHWNTARVISKIAWGIPPEQVTEQHRAMAKTCTFGALYGKTAYGLAAEFGCSPQQAETILNAILGRYKGLAKWIQSNLRAAQRDGYVWSRWAGEAARRRPLVDLASPDEKRRVHAENANTNHPVQGSANEFQLMSLAMLVEWIEEEGLEDDVKLVLPVHDSLLFEVSDWMVHETADKVRAVMCSHDSEGVPLAVDMEVGRAWGSLGKYEPVA